jgi:hypothetical protein
MDRRRCRRDLRLGTRPLTEGEREAPTHPSSKDRFRLLGWGFLYHGSSHVPPFDAATKVDDPASFFGGDRNLHSSADDMLQIWRSTDASCRLLAGIQRTESSRSAARN